MPEEANIAPDAVPGTQNVIADPNSAMADMLKSLLAPMQAQLTQLMEENKAHKSENSKLREELNELLATPHAGNVIGNDIPANPNAARSVVIATRPVQDNPELYSQKPIVDSSALVRNDASPLSGKNRE
jgi:hypothetical protein